MATPAPSDIINWTIMSQDPNRPMDSRVPLILGLEISMIVFAGLTVLLRLYARQMKHALGWDDWLMLSGLIVSTVNTVISCVSTKYGMGKHPWNEIRPEYFSIAGELGFIYQVLFVPAVTLTKTSIVMTYLRVFTQKKDRYYCYFAIGFINVYAVVCFFMLLFQCVPIESFWNITMTSKSCMNQEAAMIATSSVNSFTDLLVFLWPAPKLWDVALPKRQRVGLIIVFSLGCIVCVAGIVRIVYYPIYFGSVYVLWEGAILTVAAAIECDLAIICGSLPEIRPLVLKIFKKQGTSNGSGYDRTGRSQGYSTRSGRESELKLNVHHGSHIPLNSFDDSRGSGMGTPGRMPSGANRDKYGYNSPFADEKKPIVDDRDITDMKRDNSQRQGGVPPGTAFGGDLEDGRSPSRGGGEERWDSYGSGGTNYSVTIQAGMRSYGNTTRHPAV